MSSFHAITNMVDVLEQDQHHLDLDCKPQIDTFLEIARSVRDICLLTPGIRFHIPMDLQVQMEHIAHEAEDAIEVYVTNLLLPGTDEIVFELDLTDLMEQFEYIRLNLLQIANDIQDDVPDTLINQEQFQSLPMVDQRTKLDIPAIFEDDFQTLKSRIIGGSSKLQIISIDGPVGMGKRTLARRLYNDPEIAANFRTRAWLTSPFIDSSEKNCLLSLLEGLGKLTNDMRLKTVNELKVHVRNTLQYIKYFIVIHDVLGVKTWVTFTRLFREYGVGARVLYTNTGSIDHATQISYGGQIHATRFMNDCESWLLFCQKVFGLESCPRELEPIGKMIVWLCKGCPLAVTLIAGLLTTNKKTPTTWMAVAGMLSQMLEGSVSVDELIIRKILYFIYIYLPNYLRPCLLYVGAFHESLDIKASTIIKLWIAEGFVKQSGGKSSEYLAEMYLQILVDVNLLSLTQLEPNGRVKAFQVHPFLRLFYWRVAAEEKFIGSTLFCYLLKRGEEKNMRRVSIDGLFTPLRGTELPVLARSFLALSGASLRQDYMYLELRLLRVLAVFLLEFYQFPIQIMQLVLLRYLSISCHSNLPTSFSKFRNLQTLIIRRIPTFRAFSLPSDLWELAQLINVKCKETFIWYNPRDGKRFVHEKLQTLSNVQLFGIQNEFLREVPNIKQLGIFCNIAMHTVFDLACLDKLERLKCSSDWSLASRNFLSYLTIPLSLRKLTLSLCRIPSEFMKVVGSLPILEHLKLQRSDFAVGVDSAKTELTWAPVEGGFPKLLSLEMIHLNLVHWKTQASHFPSLKHLNIENCYAMVEIPLDIGNIQTLELIQVTKTSPLALVSALKIKEDQEVRGNKLLQLRTYTYVF